MRAALVNLVRTRFSSLPIGLMSLAAFARRRHAVEIIESDAGDPHAQLCAAGPYDVIGISAMTVEYERATRLARQIKVSHPAARIVIGGVHISTLPESFRPCFDLALPGEGERKFLDLLDGRYDGRRAYPRLDLSDYPPLDYDAINPLYFRRRYLSAWNESGVPGVILTSRGCPFRCVFCSTSVFWKGRAVKFFPADWVLSEIKAQAARGVTHLSVWDDLFTLNKPRLRELAARFEAEGLRLTLSVQSRVNTLDDEMCEILCRLGVRSVNFGFESGNERVLRWLKCNTTTVSDNERAVRLCRRHGLLAVGSLIIPPGVSRRENLDTVRFAWRAFRNGADSLWYFPLTPLPGTPLWQKARAAGEVGPDMNFDTLALSNPRAVPLWVRWLMFAVRGLLRFRRLVRRRPRRPAV